MTKVKLFRVFALSKWLVSWRSYLAKTLKKLGKIFTGTLNINRDWRKVGHRGRTIRGTFGINVTSYEACNFYGHRRSVVLIDPPVPICNPLSLRKFELANVHVNQKRHLINCLNELCVFSWHMQIVYLKIPGNLELSAVENTCTSLIPQKLNYLESDNMRKKIFASLWFCKLSWSLI